MSALTDLQAAAAANTQAISAAVSLINNLRTKVTDLTAQVADLNAQITDQAALAAVTDEITKADASIPTA